MGCEHLFLFAIIDAAILFGGYCPLSSLNTPLAALHLLLSQIFGRHCLTNMFILKQKNSFQLFVLLCNIDFSFSLWMIYATSMTIDRRRISTRLSRLSDAAILPKIGVECLERTRSDSKL